MCGIAGIIELKDGMADAGLVRGMTDAIAHRGPDADGFFVEGGAGLGHRRLSIIDLSAESNQPFHDPSGRYVLVYNGEMYNYSEVKAKLPDHPFRTAGDTEVLLAAYIRWGADCLRHFRGMYAFVIWDRQERTAFLCRDKMGVKPLYYAIAGDSLLFSSEVRSILSTGLVAKEIDQKALLDYFSDQSIPYPYTVVKGVRQLEAGAWMRIKDGKIEQQRYWDVTNNPVDFDFGDKERVHGRIRELMLQSIRRRLVSDVPVGAFLSGGIDSSAVVGLMAEASSSPANTFNISFDEKAYDESEYADIVAKKFSTHHTRLLLQPRVFLDELENALDAMDSPSGDGINTYVVSKAISQKGMRVALSGAGGDELFAGYPFFSQYLRLQQRSWLWRFPQGIRSIAAAVLSGGQQTGKRGRIGQLLCQPSPAVVDIYPLFRQIMPPALISRLSYLSSGRRLTTAVGEELRSRQQQIKDLPFLSQVSAAEYLGYTQHTLLKDTDQMSMAVSLEVREPFFDQDLVEFVLAVPDCLKNPSYPKSLLVESLKPLLPDEIVFRKKQGFLFPWDVWLRNDLKAFCDRYIKNMAGRSFINGGRLVSYWSRFLAGDKQVRWSEIWLFVVLEYWLEKNGVS
ncbi:MAG TPA: asparagine synthase (glutamine-hydrolyzing) [Puia sp.]|jgi:asparagine synthase (glutamine-hydrolysing)|nr:asparagine synthase (glutamine-hydrolyzing) [Puia sp.]